MAVGWTRDNAVQDQIDATVAAGVQRAKTLLPSGASLTHCETCRTAIPEARRQAIPGVRFCLGCQAKLERVE
jgi:phage/conjugal plasmid C-4 type zinc finger TraR family protein